MSYSRRKLLIEEREPLGADTARPSKWWRYGAIAAGAGLAAARLGGVAFAAPHDAVHDTTPSWSYDPGHDAATWTLASQEYAPGHGDGNKDDKKGGDSGKQEKNGAKQAAKPQEPAKPQAAQHQQDDDKHEDRGQSARFQGNQGDQGQAQQGENQQAKSAKHATPQKVNTPKTPSPTKVVAQGQATPKSTKVPTAVSTAVLGEQATPVDDQGKVGICHETGSSSNPRVFIEVSKNAVKAHEGHGDRAGVSGDDCASGQVGVGTPTAQPTSTVPAATSTPVPTDTATVQATGTAQPTGTVEITGTATVNPNETVVVTETPVPTGTAQATTTVQATATVGATGTPQATGTVQPTQTATVTGTPTAEVLGEQSSRGLFEVLVANLSKLLGGLFAGK
jgi:hypothetical protein